MFFADESILFAKTDGHESERVKHVLKVYEDNSGQKINLDKSALFFSSNTCHELREHIKDLYRVKSIEDMEKYLGLPASVGRHRRKAFKELNERLNMKV